jgi:hypothetical protein
VGGGDVFKYISLWVLPDTQMAVDFGQDLKAARRLSKAELDALEDAWKSNPTVKLEDLEQKEVEEALPAVQLQYAPIHAICVRGVAACNCIPLSGLHPPSPLPTALSVIFIGLSLSLTLPNFSLGFLLTFCLAMY